MSRDDEDQGHSINDDYRMVGLRGDDESDLEVDEEELLGYRAAPIEVANAAGDGAAGTAASDGAVGAVAGNGAATIAGDPTAVAIDT
jgi:hypothetical protein